MIALAWGCSSISTPSETGLLLPASDGGLARRDVDLGDPFGLEGLSPSHGPFAGGTRSVLSGRGFASQLRVIVGSAELTAASLVVSDPNHAAVLIPMGPPGYADVTIVDGASGVSRTLPKAFLYDPIVVAPNSGATSGGTRITLDGSGTSWTTTTQVTVGGANCQNVRILSATRLECETPPGSAGSSEIVVRSPTEADIQVRDAFTYSDSPDGNRGGLAGGPLSDRVRVQALDRSSGAPLAGARIIVSDPLPTPKVGDTAISGSIEFSGVGSSPLTVTITAHCYQPITFVDVPVDSVTGYLEAVGSPACGQPDPNGGGGGSQRFGSAIDGELVFAPGGNGEFGGIDWTGVPSPKKPTERRAAYVFEASSSSSVPFALPGPGSAVTPDSVGTAGYTFSYGVSPGNVTLYAIAGLEDRSASPPSFLPYVMGVVQGVNAPTASRATGVVIPMNIAFDHQVTLAAEPPGPGARGPDRFASSVAVTLGTGFAVFPGGSRVASLPVPSSIPVVGVPALGGALALEQYVLEGTAATGPTLSFPASVVARVRTSDSNAAVSLGTFLEVPVLSEPGNGIWDGRTVRFGHPLGQADLSVVTVTTGGGLTRWTIVAPGTRDQYTLPDLATLVDASFRLFEGALTATVYIARVPDFSYDRLRTSQLSPSAWTAYAVDGASGVFAP